MHREVGGRGAPGDVGAARCVHRDAISSIVAAVTPHGAAAQERGVDPGGARRVHFAHEGVVTPAHVIRLVGVDGREPYGICTARYVGVAGAVYRDTVAGVRAFAAQEGRVHQAARRVELDDKGVRAATTVSRLNRIAQRE